MTRQSLDLINFKVRQVIGSIAIDGVQVSEEMQEVMLRIATGQESAMNMRDALVEKYSQLSSVCSNDLNQL